jgi:hypothetical protein
MKNTRPLLAALVLSAAAASTAHAVTYDFLSDTFVSSGTTVFKSQFNSLNGNGVINVTDTFASTAGVGFGENVDSYITPSEFSTVFPGSGSSIQGHLGMTVYNNTATFYFDTSAYTITPQTIFGMWNISNEVPYPSGGPGGGGNPVYRMQLFDGTNIVNPTTLTVYGKQDNTGSAGVNGQQEIDMNPADGFLSPGATINGGVGTHTSATFWNNIPTGTKAIIVYADLPPLNTIGDGVGYYFAEVHVPEPASLGILAAGALALVLRRKNTVK